jgi:excisionase family DNA binding protein
MTGTSLAEQQRRATQIENSPPLANQRALSIPQFCQRYGPGKSTAYQEIQAGRLRARKVGRRTLITLDDAERWLRDLPEFAASENTP